MERELLRALIIEDMEEDVELLLHALRQAGYAPEYTSVDNRADLIEALKQEWQIVFSDFTMPAFDGHEALRLVRKQDPDLPFIFVSGTMGEERAVQAVKAGAQDYIIKGNLKRLSAAVPRELREAEMRRERRRSKARIQYLANHDELTALPNRLHYIGHLNRAIEQAQQSELLVGLILLNLDRFRDVNNSLGHAAGDLLLKEVASRLQQCVQRGDMVARLSGDEFALTLSGLRRRQELQTVIERVATALAEPLSISGYSLYPHASCGVSVYPFDGHEAEELQRNAAMAMHQAKTDGGRDCRFFRGEIRDRLQQRLRLERELEGALKAGGFELHFQPQVEPGSGRIVATEALIRWSHPHWGAVSPGQFIPVAEETGLILPISEWVLESACRQAIAWRDDRTLHHRPRVAVNFSAFQFRQENLVEKMEEMLQKFELTPEALEIEITETALMQDPDRALAILSRLRDLGFSISLDDFGTGYSSLSYLKRFPVNVLKIDQSFIRDLPGDEEDISIIRAIIALAERLHLTVVAEGVETQEQLDFLSNEGCDLVQGYFFQPPATGEALTPLLQAESPFANAGATLQ